MISCCVVYTTSIFFPEENYPERFRKAGLKTPPASALEDCVTNIACGALSASCCIGYPYSQGVVAKAPFSNLVGGVFCCASVCFVVNAKDSGSSFFSQGYLTTGCVRDCKVLQKTFEKKPKLRFEL